jgi:hypothetical protein
MPFSPPDFNLFFDFWYPGHIPAIWGGPDLIGVPCQLYVYSKPSLNVDQARIKEFNPPIYLRVDQVTWFGTVFTAPVVDGFCKMAIGPGGVYSAYWQIAWWEVMHEGFPNSYVQALLYQTDSMGNIPDPNR